MHMLQSGVAFSVIALWLGHESMTTTHRYVEADLTMKQNALARLQEPAMEPTRYQPPDELMRPFWNCDYVEIESRRCPAAEALARQLYTNRAST